MTILKVWQLTLIWQNKTPWGRLYKKMLFNPLLMRKHDFWHVQWFLNGQKWGINKKTSLYDPFEGLTTDSYLAKQDPLGGGQIKKRLFNPLLMRKHDFWHVQWFLNGQKWGVKKSISVWPFWRFDNWLLFGKTRPHGGRSDRKKCFFNPLSDEKTWFLTCPVVFKWSNMGVKKRSLYDHFEGLTTDSLFWQNKTLWGEVV